jgi:tRNA G10  N-methylase Trm11
MSTYLFILGKHPELSIAELKMRYPKHRVWVKGDDFVVMDVSKKIDQKEFNQIGGCLKAAEFIKEVKKEALVESLAKVLKGLYQDKKLDYGLSLYGLSEKQLRPILLKLKKRLKVDELKSRFINKNFQNISSAQYKSIQKKGVELIVVNNKGRMTVGITVATQDIDAYSKRDYEKPFRDMQMGMLPPKLAQILINLSGVRGKIWDPFCGSGTLVMEGLLMGRSMIGSDINPKHVEGAKKNVEWLKRNFQFSIFNSQLFVHDATETLGEKFDAIAFEGDLGLPHGRSIKPIDLQKIVDELEDLYVRFFKNLKGMKHRVPIVAALPFFKIGKQERRLKNALGLIQKLGFKPTHHFQYSREGQAVGRDIYRFM